MGDGLKLGLDAAQTPVPDGLGGTRRLPSAIVLLSDGANTRGADPIDIARRGQAGRRSGSTRSRSGRRAASWRSPPGRLDAPQKVPPDTLTLQEIARDTGGRYFNAPDSDQLEAVYRTSRPGSRPSTRSRRSPRRSRAAGSCCCSAGWHLAAARGAAPVSRLRLVPPAPERTPERPGPGPVPAQVLRSLDLAVMRRIESLIPGEHLTPQVGAAPTWRGSAPTAGRRRPPHRLERHRADARAARRVHVGERALTALARARRLGLDDVRDRRPAQGRRRQGRRARGRPRRDARGNRLGVMAFGDGGAARAPARQGRLGCRAAGRAARGSPGADGAGAPRSASECAGRGLARARGLVVIVSDFRVPARLEGPLRALRGRHGGWRSRSATRASWSSRRGRPLGDGPRDGPPGRRSTRPPSASVSASPRAAAAEREKVARALRRAGADHLVLSTEGDWLREARTSCAAAGGAARGRAVARRGRAAAAG